MKTVIAGSNGMAGVVPDRGTAVRDWQCWAPYPAVAWSLVYAALGIYWAVSGHGFPYTSEMVAKLGCYYRRRGPCDACGRGANTSTPLHGVRANGLPIA